MEQNSSRTFVMSEKMRDRQNRVQATLETRKLRQEKENYARRIDASA